MNGLVAAIKFLLETVIENKGSVPTLTYTEVKPHSVYMGKFTEVPASLVPGYYVLSIPSETESSESDDFEGYWECTADGN